MSSKPALLTMLAVTVATTGWLAVQPEPSDDLVVPARASKPREVAYAPVESASASAVPAGQRGAWAQAPDAAIAAWGAPAPPAPPPPPAALAVAERPKPPPFPYKWIGQVVDGADVQALLSSPQRSFGARVGSVLDGRWRIERIADGRIEATWLETGDVVAVDTR